MSNDIELGDEVEDLVSGLRGIVILEYRYLHGQPRCLVQPQCEYSFVMPDSHVLEYGQLKLITKNKVGGEPAYTMSIIK